MYWETLPSWVWVIYYIFLLSTIGIAIVNLYKRQMFFQSVITIILTITVPIVSMVNSIGRVAGMNELEHLVAQLQVGSLWSIYAVIGFIYLFVYWFLFIYKRKISISVS